MDRKQDETVWCEFMKLSPYGKPQTTQIMVCAVIALVVFGVLKWWVGMGVVVAVALALLSFFRDPEREIPQGKGEVVAPADGVVTSVHDVEHFEAFGGGAKCIRIFMSVLNVHVNRAPMAGRVESLMHRPGKFLNTLKAEAADENEWLTMVMTDAGGGRPVVAVRQIAGAIARRIVNGMQEGDVLERGERYGLIKFGSTTDVYLPSPGEVEASVEVGQRVYGGTTVIAVVGDGAASEGDEDVGMGEVDVEEAGAAVGAEG